jgi:predicted PurR-regulated permease PerM
MLTNTAMDLVVEPKLMKTSLDISPLVVILSLIFWGWLLGPAGTILAIPLTMVVQRTVAPPPAPVSASSGS